MRKAYPFLLLLAGLTFPGCNDNGGPAPADSTVQEINRQRAEIENSWKNFTPADGQVDTVQVGEGEISESPDGDAQHVCEFLYDQADFRFTWQASSAGYRIFRDLLSYRLGNATNMPAAICAKVADRDDDFSVLGFALTGAILLNLDKLKDEYPQDLEEVRPVQMVKQRFQAYDVYHLTYFLKGRLSANLAGLENFIPLEQRFEGTLQVTFATQVPTAAWVWQMKWDVTVNGQSTSDLRRSALAINGVALPVY